MIPILLTIKGLYSYQETQVIDFAKLTESRLFGIFGPVGCGKSSILEAITFALYGETERLTSRDDRNYNMMNLKSTELLIDFQFKPDIDTENIYRFVVKGKRSKDESVKTFDRQAYRKNGGDWIPLPDKDAQDILKLEYQDFRRTVIIPQGKFREFLELGGTERTNMLKRLFKLEQFELYNNTTALRAKNKTNIEITKSQLAEVANITPERLEELKKAIKSISDKKALLTLEIEKKEFEIKQLQSLKELFEKLKEKESKVEKLEEQKPHFEKRELEIREYQNCLLNLKPLLDEINNIISEANSVKNNYEIRSADYLSKKDFLDIEEKRFIEIKNTYENRNIFEKQLEELSKIIEIKKRQTDIDVLSGRISNGKLTVEKTDNEIVKLKAEKTKAQEELNNLTTEFDKLKEVHEVSEWFVKMSNLRKLVEKSKASYESAKYEIESADAKKISFLKENGSSIFSNGAYQLSDSELIKYIDNAKEQLNVQTGKLKEELDVLKARNSLQDFASSLQDGKPCPLCGSLEHPSPLDTHNINEEVVQRNNNIKKLESDIRLCDALLSQISISVNQKETYNKLLSNSEKELNEYSGYINDLLREFRWAGYRYDDEIKVRQDIKRKNEIQSLLQNQSQQITLFEKSIESLQKDKEKYEKALHELIQKNDKITTEKDTYLKQFNRLSYDVYKNASESAIEKEIAKIDLQMKNTIKEYQSAEPKLNSFRSELSALSGQINELEKQWKFKQDQLGHKNEILNLRLREMGYLSRSEVDIVLSGKIDIEAERTGINDFFLLLKSEQSQLDLFRIEAEGKTYDYEFHQSLAVGLKSDKESLTGLNESAGALNKELKDTQVRFEHKKELNKELERLEKRSANLDIMLNLFRSQGFVNYVSTQYLRNLVHAANDRFTRLTTNQFHLELREIPGRTDNTFEVCDHLNGGKMRHIKTLSGGQTFQASLSLALALSENISIFNKARLNFFFLDEGFGTLDRESLHVVFDTLKSLRKENRIVGVISHVEDLQQEIEHYIVASIDGEKGSTLRASWE